jgi:hypothetical protein
VKLGLATALLSWGMGSALGAFIDNDPSLLVGAKILNFEDQIIGTYSSITIEEVTFHSNGNHLRIDNSYQAYNQKGVYLDNGTYGNNGFMKMTISFSKLVSAFAFTWGMAEHDQKWFLTAFDATGKVVGQVEQVPSTGASSDGEFYGIAKDIAGPGISSAVLETTSYDWIAVDDFTYVEDGRCQDPVIDTCDFYADCLESAFECRADGYPLHFGERLCRVFLDNDYKFSASDQDWSSAVRKCLQDALVHTTIDLRDSISCDDLKALAFSSHVDCYIDNGFCDIELSDYGELVLLMKDELYGTGSLAVWEQFVHTSWECGPDFISRLVSLTGEVVTITFYDPFKQLLETFHGSLENLKEYLYGEVLKILEDELPLLPQGIALEDLIDRIIFWDVLEGSTLIQLLVLEEEGNGFDAALAAKAIIDATKHGTHLELTFVSATSCAGDECGRTLFENKDTDSDGILNGNDLCPGTSVPESIGVGKNRWVLDGDSSSPLVFKTARPKTEKVLTIEDTFGCSCEQIILECEYGLGHSKFGCSTGVLERWSAVPIKEGRALNLRCE